MNRLLVPALLASFTGGALAQTTTVTFQVDPAQSNWTWAATANGIAVTPTTTNQFQMGGTFDVELDFNAGGFASAGQIVGGNVTVTPDVAGSVSFLATVVVEDLVMSPAANLLDFGNPPTSIGNFATDIVWTTVSGTAIIDPLFGATSFVDLAGAPTSPALINGSITTNPDGTLHWSTPQVLQLLLMDPGTGITFVVDLDGTLTADELRFTNPICFGDGSGNPCPCGNSGGAGEGCANGTGAGAVLSSTGSTSLAAADLVLSGSNLVPNQPGLYFQGDNAVAGGNGAIFGDGLRCAGGNVRRLQVRNANASGVSSTTVNIGLMGAALAGQTRRYQLWYRDPATSPCGTSFNLSNGYEIVWVP